MFSIYVSLLSHSVLSCQAEWNRLRMAELLRVVEASWRQIRPSRVDLAGIPHCKSVMPSIFPYIYELSSWTNLLNVLFVLHWTSNRGSLHIRWDVEIGFEHEESFAGVPDFHLIRCIRIIDLDVDLHCGYLNQLPYSCHANGPVTHSPVDWSQD